MKGAALAASVATLFLSGMACRKTTPPSPEASEMVRCEISGAEMACGAGACGAHMEEEKKPQVRDLTREECAKQKGKVVE